MRLLVALDNRDGGRDALELARVIGNGERVSALLVTVLYPGAIPMDYAIPSGEEEDETRSLFEAAREKLPGIEVEARAYEGGSPAGILTRIAEGEDFDAIVIGSPHRGALGRVMIGSVASSLLNGAPADVVVAPRGYAAERHDVPRTIAVGYDGTPESRVALRHAEAIAHRSNAKLEILTVVRPPIVAPVMVPGISAASSPAEPETMLSEALESVDSLLPAECARLDGDPALELVEACEEGVDLLAVGSRGYGPLTRVLLGSVSRQVAQKASCPVLVAKRP
jgi:nucleotide-binding universal stress UspA family protein